MLGVREGERGWWVVVLSWNGRDDTLACLRSLTEGGSPPAEVVCVDNGSTDGSAEAVRREFPQVTLIETGANLGFAGGNNVGIRSALEHGADWVVLLNNDASLAPDAISAFKRVAGEHPQAGVLGGKVFFQHPPDRIWFAGQRFNARLGYSGRPRGYGRRDGDRYERVVRIDRAVGALMAVSREAMAAAGLLDEELFAYVEDVDWALRVREAGFEVLLAPQARAWHRVSASGGGDSLSTHPLYYGARNTIVVCERHAPMRRLGTVARRLVVAATFAARAVTRPNRADALRAVYAGVRDALAGRLGMRPS